MWAFNFEEEHVVVRSCDHPGCAKAGEYPAPKSPRTLQERYYFCLDHIRRYNATWNYYADMTLEEATRSRDHDITWERPAWPFGVFKNPNASTMFLNDFWGLLRDLTPEDPTLPKRTPLSQEAKALSVLELSWPFSEKDLKKAYKTLAKKYHPDLNQNNPTLTQKFQEIKEAYDFLLVRISIKNG